MHKKQENIIPLISEIIERRGHESYLGEELSMREHMLQTAFLAENEGGSDEEIAVALLHDIGHYTNEFPDDALENGQNNFHEDCGANILSGFFPETVVEAVRHHVEAKRYLCAVESGYFACLSAASVNSLNVQGGPMNEDEIDKFEKYACKKLSVKVRKWDDAAKVVGMSTPPFSHFVPVLERVLIIREK